jgi:Pro-Pro endopeptidase
MAMKKRLIIVLSVLILFLSPSVSFAAEKVYWDGMELKKGQSGRLTVTKPINLWKRTESGLEFIRILKPGERYRVYRYDSLYGGQYGLGGGLYVTNMKGYIRYETPSRDKRMLVNYEKQYFVERIIDPPTENYDKAEAKKIAKRIEQIPGSLLYQLWNYPVKIHLTNGPITDTEYFSYLKGVTPRGWEDTNLTWEDVPGVGGTENVVIRIGYSEKGKGHNSINLELHEIAHTIDQLIKGNASSSSAYLSIWEKEKDILFRDYSYFTQHPEEYYAETFAMYFLNDASRKKLQTMAPKTYQYIQKQFQSK